MTAAPNFCDWLQGQIGPKWVIARGTLNNIRRYGPDTVFLSCRRYKAFERQYERATLQSAHGLPGELPVWLHKAFPPLLTAARGLLAAHDGGKNRTPAIEMIRAAVLAFENQEDTK